jgi:hypothetical protein
MFYIGNGRAVKFDGFGQLQHAFINIQKRHVAAKATR